MITEVREAYDIREVEGVIELCKMIAKLEEPMKQDAIDLVPMIVRDPRVLHAAKDRLGITHAQI